MSYLKYLFLIIYNIVFIWIFNEKFMKLWDYFVIVIFFCFVYVGKFLIFSYEFYIYWILVGVEGILCMYLEKVLLKSIC